MAAALGLALFRDRGMTKPCFGKGLKFTEGWLRRSGMKLQGAPNRCKQGLKIQILPSHGAYTFVPEAYTAYTFTNPEVSAS